MPERAPRASYEVELLIDLRAEIAAGRFDPARDRVGVRGSFAPLDWGRSLPAEPAGAAHGEGRWRVRLRFDGAPFGDQPVAYKLKIDRPGADANAGWEDGRNHVLLLTPEPLRIERRFNAPAEALPPRRTGRIDRLAPIASAHVDAREVQVWLPPGYQGGTSAHPVLYLHDGQNVFDGDAAGAEWQVDETAQRLVLAGAIEPPIVVGVASTGRRVHDYTPQPGTSGPFAGTGGGAPAYARYLLQELKPAIDARYRTRPGREHTAVGGSSLGGLVTMWLLLKHADRFGAGLVVSPSVWWADATIVREVAAQPAGAPKARVWLDTGMQEGEGAWRGARRLHEALRAAGWPVRYTEDAAGTHDEAAWAARVEPMLRFLYGRG